MKIFSLENVGSLVASDFPDIEIKPGVLRSRVQEAMLDLYSAKDTTLVEENVKIVNGTGVLHCYCKRVLRVIGTSNYQMKSNRYIYPKDVVNGYVTVYYYALNFDEKGEPIIEMHHLLYLKYYYLWKHFAQQALHPLNKQQKSSQLERYSERFRRLKDEYHQNALSNIDHVTLDELDYVLDFKRNYKFLIGAW